MIKKKTIDDGGVNNHPSLLVSLCRQPMEVGVVWMLKWTESDASVEKSVTSCHTKTK